MTLDPQDTPAARGQPPCPWLAYQRPWPAYQRPRPEEAQRPLSGGAEAVSLHPGQLPVNSQYPLATRVTALRPSHARRV